MAFMFIYVICDSDIVEVMLKYMAYIRPKYVNNLAEKWQIYSIGQKSTKKRSKMKMDRQTNKQTDRKTVNNS